jgi:hypothetical protein
MASLAQPVDPVRFCPNPACPFRRKFGRPADYRVDVAACSDCGTALQDAEASGEAPRQGWPEVAICLDSALETEPSEVDLGARVGESIELRNMPAGTSIPVASMVAGAALGGYALYQHGAVQAQLLRIVTGAALLVYGLLKLRACDRRKRRIERWQGGFIYHVDDRRVVVPFAQIKEPAVQHQVLRTRWISTGFRIELIFSFQGRCRVVACFAKGRGEAFEQWAESIRASA